MTAGGKTLPDNVWQLVQELQVPVNRKPLDLDELLQAREQTATRLHRGAWRKQVAWGESKDLCLASVCGWVRVVVVIARVIVHQWLCSFVSVLWRCYIRYYKLKGNSHVGENTVFRAFGTWLFVIVYDPWKSQGSCYFGRFDALMVGVNVGVKDG